MKYYINIEYCHIYSDQVFTEEHKKSVIILDNLIKKLGRNNVVLTVLVDEYNPKPEKTILNLDDFLITLDNLGYFPDYIGYESKLAFLKDYVLNQLSDKLKRQYLSYIEKYKKVPCSLLITIWYFLRLGIDKKLNEEAIRYECIESLCLQSLNDFPTSKIVTILPRKYHKVEELALRNIESTKYKNKIQDIQTIFY